MDTRIQIGDKVTFHFASGDKIFGKVIDIPALFGEEWIIQSYYEGKEDAIVYILNFDYIYLRK